MQLMQAAYPTRVPYEAIYERCGHDIAITACNAALGAVITSSSLLVMLP